MKQLVLVAAAVLAVAVTASGQTGEIPTSPPADVYEIGARQVRIPAPDGFIKIGHRHGRFLSVQIAAEPEQNEIFAVHAPAAELPRFQGNFDHSPDIFTKVSVSKIGRDEDVSAAGFESLGTYIENEFARITDPTGEAMLAGQKQVSKNITDLLDSRTKVKFDRPVHLGVFDKNARVHSTLSLLKLSVNKDAHTFVATVSFVYVNKRLIYVYAYKANPTVGDAEMLSEFTKKWTASIVTANSEIAAKVQ